MSTRPPPHRLAAGIRVCAALLLLAASCASDASPGAAGPHFTGQRLEAFEPGAISTGPEASTTPPPSTSAPPLVESVVPEAPAEEPLPEEPPQTEEPQPEEPEPEPAEPQTEEPEPEPAEPEPAGPQTEEPEPAEPQTEEPEPEPAEPEPAEPQTEEPEPAEPEPQPENPQTAWAELPSGDQLLFETGDDMPDRRLVAVYGHPSTAGLGVLGEQGPEAAVERLRSIAAGYGADGLAVLPTFEVIVTVASASAGADGDYSSVTDHEVIRPWIEVAAANDVYVVLDLQPGRSDFLSQAKLYEEFLRLPHVGLALDPEWRLKPHEVHLRQVGTVDAAEINQVVDWLAGIVREEGLPQKLLIVHQFRFSMITNRELIETPPELAVMIHMDGQGSLSAKYNTWNTLTGEADADRFYWGWKNFYDEDSPMATPEQVLARSPKIFYVSFQ